VPVVSADRKGVRLDIRVERSDLAPGTPARTVRLNVNGQEQKYQIQQPVMNIQQLQTKVQLSETQTLVLPLGKMQASKSAPMSDIPFVGQFFACEKPASEECRYYLVITPKIYTR
jgi:type II secretory pathway component GspD/PulD (secretin)